MIRFSAFLVVVAVGLLVAGVVTSTLLLVYVAIGVSAVALVALGAGTALHRDELFGKPKAADSAAAAFGQLDARASAAVRSQPQAHASAAAFGQPEARASAGVRIQPAEQQTQRLPEPAEQDAQRLSRPAVAAPNWQGPLTWGPHAIPARADHAPGDRRGPEPSVPAPVPERGWSPPGTSRESGSAAAETSVDLPPVPAAAETSVDLPPVPAAAETSVDLPPVPADPDAKTPARPSEARETTEPPPAADTASGMPGTPEAEASAEPDPQREVTVVPGVPRYHDAHCILIRFMGDGDLQKVTVAAARDSGCTPCRACQPDKPGQPGQ